MTKNSEKTGEGQGFEDESTEKELPRYAGTRHSFDEDTDEAFRLPRPTPEVTEDDNDAGSAKKAGSAIDDDLEIEVDQEEVDAESDSPGRKY